MAAPLRCGAKGLSIKLLCGSLRLQTTSDASRIGWPLPSIAHCRRRSLHLPNPFRSNYNYRPLDGVPANCELIYRSTMNNYVVYTYAPMVGTATAALGAVAFSFFNDFLAAKPISEMPMLFDNHWEMAIATPIIVGIAFATRLVVDRCVLRMYLDEEQHKFVAIFATLLPWRVRKFEFGPGQMRYMYDPEDDEADEAAGNVPRGGPFRAFRGEYALGRRRLIIFQEYFKRPYHYNIMMGFTN